MGISEGGSEEWKHYISTLPLVYTSSGSRYMEVSSAEALAGSGDDWITSFRSNPMVEKVLWDLFQGSCLVRKLAVFCSVEIY